MHWTTKYLACPSQPLHKLTSNQYSGAHSLMPHWSTLQPLLSVNLCWQWEETVLDKEAQLSTFTTRRRTHGTRWETYLLKDKIVPVVCYRVERFLLLEDTIATTNGLAEWMLQLERTNHCIVILFASHLSGLGTRPFFLLIFIMYTDLDFLHSDFCPNCCHFLMCVLFCD